MFRKLLLSTTTLLPSTFPPTSSWFVADGSLGRSRLNCWSLVFSVSGRSLPNGTRDASHGCCSSSTSTFVVFFSFLDLVDLKTLDLSYADAGVVTSMVLEEDGNCEDTEDSDGNVVHAPCFETGFMEALEAVEALDVEVTAEVPEVEAALEAAEALDVEVTAEVPKVEAALEAVEALEALEVLLIAACSSCYW